MSNPQENFILKKPSLHNKDIDNSRKRVLDERTETIIQNWGVELILYIAQSTK
jgi:hypothetical protein